MAKDFYEELGVARGASADEIKKAYRKLAAKQHPDRHPGDKKVETRFKALNRAFQTLSDPDKRGLYDEFGEDALREGFNPQAARAYRRGASPSGAGGRSVRFEDMFTGEPSGGGPGLGDLFGDLFGGGRARGGRSGAGLKGSDVASEVMIDFIEAIRGGERELRLQNGGAPVVVRIPPGAADGDRLRVAGHGAPGPFGGPAGDLVLAIQVRPHPFFERRGLDLHLDLPVTVGEAWKGAKVPLPTPEGMVTLTVPKRTQSGQLMRLKGKGVRRRTDVGDLYVRFLIRLPESDSKDLERAILELDRFAPSDPREGITL